MEPVEIAGGDSPLILGRTQAGAHVPDAMTVRPSDEARVLRDAAPDARRPIVTLPRPCCRRV